MASPALKLICAMFYLQIQVWIAYYQISRQNFSCSKLRLSPWYEKSGFDSHHSWPQFGDKRNIRVREFSLEGKLSSYN